MQDAQQISLVQTLTPVVGFLGVIITLTVNAVLARRARAAELKAKQCAVSSAVLAELEIVREGFAETIKQLSEPLAVDAGALIPASKYTFVFDQMINQLGVLPTATVKLVVYAYMSIEAHYQHLVLICGEPRKYGDKIYVFANQSLLASLTKGMQGLIPKLDNGISALRESQQ